MIGHGIFEAATGRKAKLGFGSRTRPVCLTLPNDRRETCYCCLLITGRRRGRRFDVSISQTTSYKNQGPIIRHAKAATNGTERSYPNLVLDGRILETLCASIPALVKITILARI